jgi:hypothetical protein
MGICGFDTGTECAFRDAKTPVQAGVLAAKPNSSHDEMTVMRIHVLSNLHLELEQIQRSTRGIKWLSAAQNRRQRPKNLICDALEHLMLEAYGQ